jgi:membrane-associated phospholipid phosphatase
VAASRVLLVVHWLSDVIAGLALGWAWFALCAVVFFRLLPGSRLSRPSRSSDRPSGCGVRSPSAGVSGHP